MKKILYLLLAFLPLSQTGFGQNFDPALALQLQAKLDSLKTAQNIRGISACVLIPGRGMWQGVSGVSHAGVPITADMEFGIGSNTKLFTAVTLLKLVENGLVQLDDSLHEWLPVYPNIHPDITIRQLLNHVSGINDITAIPGYPDTILSEPNRVFTPEETMAWVGAPLFSPGEDWSYCNTNYILVGMIVKSVTGQPFGKVLRDSVLTPLQLDSTFLDVEENVLGTIAHPWQNGIDINNIPRVSLNSAANAAGAMYSTSGEMAQWYRQLMGGQLLNANSLHEMTTFVGSGNYGFGIGKRIVDGRTCFTHGGSIRGYRSNMLYDSASQSIVCVLINALPASPELISQELLLTLINHPASAVEEQDMEHHVTVLPNPSKGLFHLVFSENIRPEYPITVALFDIAGKNVLSQIIDSKTDMIDATHLAPGVYALRAGGYSGKLVLAF